LAGQRIEAFVGICDYKHQTIAKVAKAIGNGRLHLDRLSHHLVIESLLSKGSGTKEDRTAP